MRTTTLILTILFFSIAISNAQPAVEWKKCYGGSNTDGFFDIKNTSDGGYVAAGYARSTDGDVAGNKGYIDCWVVKLDASGNIQWQKCLGGSLGEWVAAINQTTDGGYIIAGYSYSSDGDITGHHGDFYETDVWVVKLDASGNMQWQNSMGGTDDDYAEDVKQTPDGGYIVAGSAYSTDGDISNPWWSSYDFWIVKLDDLGNIQWEKTLGGEYWDQSFEIHLTADGGYIAGGATDYSINRGVDIWVVKMDSTGNIQWENNYGGTESDWAYSLKPALDGGYIVVGKTRSTNGDVSGAHGAEDGWIVKLDNAGNLLWQKAIGGTNIEELQDVEVTSDGGYIVTGTTLSKDGDVSNNTFNGSNIWVVKLYGTSHHND